MRPTRDRLYFVCSNRELNGIGLSRPAARSTRHIEVALPAGTTYRASTEDFVRTIKAIGKVPVQRDTLYRDVRVWN